MVNLWKKIWNVYGLFMVNLWIWLIYPLVMTNIAVENHHFDGTNHGKSTINGHFQ